MRKCERKFQTLLIKKKKIIKPYTFRYLGSKYTWTKKSHILKASQMEERIFMKGAGGGGTLEEKYDYSYTLMM